MAEKILREMMEENMESELEVIEAEKADKEEETEVSIDNLPADLKRYLKEIRKFPLLTAEEEKELGRLVQEGDKEAKERMTVSNLRLVAKIAGKYVKQSGIEYADLIQDGTEGLMKAVERFDSTKGFRFSTYATWWIKQAIIRAIENRGREIRIPVHMQGKIRTIRKAESEFSETYGYSPSIQELSEKTGFTRAEIEDCYQVANNTETRSLDKIIGDESDDTLGCKVPDDKVISFDEALRKEELHSLIYGILKKMKPKEARIIIERFGLNGEEPKTLEEVGKEFRVTRERVRQLETKGMCYFRMAHNQELLKEYLA